MNSRPDTSHAPTDGGKGLPSPDAEDLAAVRCEGWFTLAVVTVYTAWVCFVVFHHEPWRDEADAWLAARDMTPRQLAHWLGAAGTPGLWYAVLMPMAKGGLPYASMSLLNMIIAASAVGVLAYHSPFPRVIRVMLVASYHLSYGYAVIARSYSLTMLLLFSTAAVLTSGRRRPVLAGTLLALLVNTNVHGFMMGSAIIGVIAIRAVQCRDFSRAALGGIALAFTGAGLAFAQLLPPAGSQQIGGTPDWSAVEGAFSRAFLPSFSTSPTWLPNTLDMGGHMAISAAFYWARALLVATIVLGTAVVIRRSIDALCVLILSVGALQYVFVFKWFSGERHAGMILLLFVFVTWVAEADRSMRSHGRDVAIDRWSRRLTRCSLAIALVVSCVVGATYGYRDVRQPYSESLQAAQFLAGRGLGDKYVVAFPDPYAGPVAAHFMGTPKFWLAGREAFGTYMVWDRDWAANVHLPQGEVVRRIKCRFPRDDYVLLVGGQPLQGSEAEGYRLIFQTTGFTRFTDEQYFIYEPIGRP